MIKDIKKILDYDNSKHHESYNFFPIFKINGVVKGGRCYHVEITKIEILDENFSIVSVHSANNKKEVISNEVLFGDDTKQAS